MNFAETKDNFAGDLIKARLAPFKIKFPSWSHGKIFIFYGVISIVISHTLSPFYLFDRLLTLSGHYHPLFWWKDSSFFTWCYAWWPHAILSGKNPFFTDYIWYPEKTNLTYVTSIPTLALVMTPFTLLLGPVFSYNLVTLLTPACNGYCAFLLADKIRLGRTSAILAGAIFGFSPYVCAQWPLHSNLSLVALLPLGVYVFIRWLREELKDWQFLAFGALIVTAEAGISLEVLLYSAVAALIALACYHNHLNGRVLLGLLKLGLCCAMTLSPFLYYFLFYSGHAEGIPTFSAKGSDLQFLFAYSPAQLFHEPNIAIINDSAQNPDNCFVIGPFLLLTLACGWRHIPVRLRVLMVLFALVPYGSPMTYANIDTGIFNPMIWVHYIPLMAHAYIARFQMMFWLVVALALGRMANDGKQTIKLCLAAAILSLLPNPRWPGWIDLHGNISKTSYFPVVPPAFFNRDFRREISGKSYIVLPYTSLGGLWQAISGMNFKAFGVYTGIPDTTPGLSADSALIAPLVNRGKGVINAAWAQQLTRYCHNARLDGILIDPDPWAPVSIVPVLRAAGWSYATQDRLVILTPPES